jgi:hypothetical protein
MTLPQSVKVPFTVREWNFATDSAITLMLIKHKQKFKKQKDAHTKKIIQIL